VRSYSGSHAAVFYFPLGPAFDLSLCQALFFSTSSLCLYYFLLHEALRFRARTRRSAKGPTGVVEHFWPQAHSWAKSQPTQSPQQPCTLVPQTHCLLIFENALPFSYVYSAKCRQTREGPWFGGCYAVAKTPQKDKNTTQKHRGFISGFLCGVFILSLLRWDGRGLERAIKLP
jgi:hypothetical protein